MSYIFKKQDKMPYDFVDVNGNKWKNCFVDSYNNYNDMLNKYEGRLIETGSMTAQSIDFLLDQRHSYFVAVMQIIKK